MAQKFAFDYTPSKQQMEKDEENKNKFTKDERFWKPTKDKDGNASAVIRFLPDMEGIPFIKFSDHSFEYTIGINKKKYWKNCISDFGWDRECPICLKNAEYWKSDFEKDIKIAKLRKRKYHFISNIFVIKNPLHPEDEGKVFLYNYGQKIYEKIKEKITPSDAIKALGEYVEFYPYDLYTGANFTLLISKSGPNPEEVDYAASTFALQSAFLKGDDKKIEAVMAQTSLLSEFTAIDKYPTNDAVIKLIGPVLGILASEEPDEPEEPDAGGFLGEPESPAPEEDVPHFPSPAAETPAEESGIQLTAEQQEDKDFFDKLLKK